MIQVRKQLEELGLNEGYNSQKASLVAVANVEEVVPDSPSFAWWMTKRNVLALRAEMTAKQTLVKAMKLRLQASGYNQYEMNAGAVKDQVAEKVVLSAQTCLRGTAVVASGESIENGIYQQAIAVEYNPKYVEAAVGQVQGKDLLRIGGLSEWERWAETVDLAKIVGSRKFRGADNVVRTVGIGFAEIPESKTGTLYQVKMRSATMLALSRARHNLSLALNAEVESEEVATVLAEETECRGSDSENVGRSSDTKMTRKSTLLTAVASEVYSKIVRHELSGCPMFVSVCAYEPAVVDSFLKSCDRERNPMPRERPLTDEPGRTMQSNANCSATGSVLIFNPVTRQYEPKK